jgi:hypothetical protein
MSFCALLCWEPDVTVRYNVPDWESPPYMTDWLQERTPDQAYWIWTEEPHPALPTCAKIPPRLIIIHVHPKEDLRMATQLASWAAPDPDERPEISRIMANCSRVNSRPSKPGGRAGGFVERTND